MVWFYLPLMHSKHYNLFILMKINSKQSLNWGTRNWKVSLLELIYNMICLPFPGRK